MRFKRTPVCELPTAKLVGLFSKAGEEEEDELELVLSLLKENFLTSSGLGLGDRTGGFFKSENDTTFNILLMLTKRKNIQPTVSINRR